MNRLYGIKKTSVFILIIILVFSCVNCKKTGVVKKPSLGKKEVFNIMENQMKMNAAVSNFSAKGYFIYKDSRQELNLAAHVKYDKKAAFTRISFYGNLDNAHWGEIVVYKGKVKMYFPIQKRFFTGSIRDFNLYSFAKINIQLSEILRLSRLNVYFINNVLRKSAAVSTRFYIIYLQNKKEIQKLFIDRTTKKITRSRIYQKGIERARLLYRYYKNINGINQPVNCTLKVLSHNLKAIIWFTKINPVYRYKKGDEVLKVGDGITEEKR